MNIEDAFRIAAITHGEATERGDSKTGNKAADELARVQGLLRSNEDGGEAAFRRLVVDPEPYVALWAASDVFLFDEALATKMLKQIASLGSGILSFNAEVTLEELIRRSGSLRRH